MLLGAVFSLTSIFLAGPLPTVVLSDAARYGIFLRLTCSEAHGQMPAAVQPAFWPHEGSDLIPDPALIFGNLPNGLRYVLMQNHYPRGRVSMHLNVQIGSLVETDAQKGLAHFLEHMAFNGSRHFAPGEMIKFFQRIGMQFGPDANAHTSFDETIYDILLPRGDVASLAEGLKVLRDYADGLLLLDAQIDKERKVVISEMRTRDSADYRTLVETLKFEYPEAKLSRRMPIGTPETLRAADRSRVKDFYDTWYRPDTMVLVMVGEFEPQQAEKLILDQFGDMTARAPKGPEVDFGSIRHIGVKSFYHYEKEAGGTTVSIESIQKVAKTTDSVARQKEWLLGYLADSIVSNRLDAMQNDPHTPFTSAAIGSGRYLKQIQYAEISADTQAENWQESLAAIEQTLRSVLEHGFYPAELDRVKKQFLSGLDNALKEAKTRNSRELARSIIHHLNNSRVLLSPQQDKEIFTPLIESITLDQVHSAFSSLWPPNQRLVLVTGNARLSDDQAAARDRILAAFKASEAKKSHKPKEIAESQFPYLPIPPKEGEIVRQQSVSDLEIAQIDYANGVRLNLKKTAFKSNEVLVNVAFGKGQASEPKDTPGISALSSSVVNDSGLGRLTADELELALTGRQTRVLFRVEENAFIFSGQTVPGEIEFLFQLLQARLLDPAFRETAYRLAVLRYQQRYEALRSSVDGGMELYGEQFLAGGDSRFGLPAMDRLEAVTLPRIGQWIGEALRNETLEVSVVGDFDWQKTVAAVSRYLGSLPARNPESMKLRPEQPNFPIGGSDRIEVQSRIPKSLVVVAYPTEDFWDIGRTRRFSALADLFTERLREKIREEMGAAYSFYVYNHAYRAYPGYGVLKAMVSAAPDASRKVAEVVKKVAAELSSVKITDDELQRILDPMVNTIKDHRQTNEYWLNSVLTNSYRFPQQLEWSRNMVEDCKAISADELAHLARKYLDAQRAATVLILPQIGP
jgi:zinc protease